MRSNDFLGKDRLERQFVDHSCKVEGNKSQATSQRLSVGLNHLRDSVGLPSPHFLFSFFLQIGNNHHFSLTDPKPVFFGLWLELLLTFSPDAVEPASKPDQTYW